MAKASKAAPVSFDTSTGYLTIPEAATQSGRSAQNLTALIKGGKLPAFNKGGKVAIKAADLVALPAKRARNLLVSALPIAD